MRVEVERVEGSTIGLICRSVLLSVRHQERKLLVWRLRKKTEIERDDLRVRYEEDLQEATNKKEHDEIGAMMIADLAQCDETLDRLASLRLLEKGKRHNLYRDDPSEWEPGAFGTHKMTRLAAAKYTRAVEEAEHEQFRRKADRRDSRIRLATAVLAGVGAAMGIINFFQK